MAAHAEIIDWAASVLSQSDFKTAVVAETPYSTVIKIELDRTSVYLKQTPADLFIEAAVITACRDICGITAIPDIIASNPQLNCFLMTSCGDTSLRRLYGGNTERTDVKPDIDLAVRALQLYRDMQTATGPHIDHFLVGVPDSRLDKLPGLYRDLVSDTALLQDYGLNETQIVELRALAETMADKCKKLAAFSIPDCLNLSDLHDDNMLMDTTTGAISIIDWGESTVDHPFLSLATCLGRFCSGYQIEAGSQDYKRLYEACFGGWGLLEEDLAYAVILAKDLSWLYWAISYQRLEQAAGRQAMIESDGTADRIKNALVMFMERMTVSQRRQ